MRWLASLLLSVLFSATLAARFFGALNRAWLEALSLVLVPALGMAVLIFLLFPWFADRFENLKHKRLLLIQALLAGLLFASFDGSSWPVRLLSSLSLLVLSFVFALPAASGYDDLAAGGRLPRFLTASAAGGVLAFFPAAFLAHSYPAYLLPLVALVVFFILEIAVYLAWPRLRMLWSTYSLSSISAALTLFLVLVFIGALAWLALGVPQVFPRERFLPSQQAVGLLLALLVISPAGPAWLLEISERRGILERMRGTAAWNFARENLPGILLGSLFFAAYSLLSYLFNHPGMDLTENFLAADVYAWLSRMASPGGMGMEMRAVHPFAFFIFRPLTWFFSLFFNGDRITAALLLVPLTGGLCVLLAYLFIKRWSGAEAYALAAAALLGASTSHLMFASLIESYIFSAAALLLFFLLLLDEKTHWLSLVAVGVLTFGITITNFIQTFIGFVVARPKIRSIFMYGLLASAIAIVLTALHAAVYPSALVFFDPAGAGAESEYSSPLLGEPGWRVTGRVVMLARNFGLYSVVAPEPFILTSEVGGRFPRFNFFKLSPGHYSHSSYSGLGTLLVLAWAGLILAAGLAFLWELIRSRKINLLAAFPVVILFNFLLHLGYGYEPFLYSADWTYALVLFVTASLAGFGKRAWFQLGMVAFLALLLVNQWVFIRTIVEAIGPFFATGRGNS